MTDNNYAEAQETAKLIRSGRYFDTAREWYGIIYLSKISDRAVFFVIAFIAAMIALICIVALSALTPIIEPRAILLKNANIDQNQLSIYPLRNKGEVMDAAVRRFFISAYVTSRESYQLSHFNASAAFIGAHSDPLVMQVYMNEISPQNPQHIAAKLGVNGERAIEITDIRVNEQSEPQVASVTFITRDWIGTQVTSVRQQVTLALYFTPLMVKEVVDKATGKVIIETEEPQFQVVQYERN